MLHSDIRLRSAQVERFFDHRRSDPCGRFRSAHRANSKRAIQATRAFHRWDPKPFVCCPSSTATTENVVIVDRLGGTRQRALASPICNRRSVKNPMKDVVQRLCARYRAKPINAAIAAGRLTGNKCLGHIRGALPPDADGCARSWSPSSPLRGIDTDNGMVINYEHPRPKALVQRIGEGHGGARQCRVCGEALVRCRCAPND